MGGIQADLVARPAHWGRLDETFRVFKSSERITRLVASEYTELFMQSHGSHTREE